MAAPVDEIVFGTALAAVNDTSHLRGYSQDVNGGIRESGYEGGWTGGVTPLTTSKVDSPIAAASKGLKNIRLYYISANNILSEYCYDAGTGFFLPTSSLQLRVYAQIADNTIQEFGYDSGSAGWQKMTNLGAALPGSSLASVSWAGSSSISIRTYLQAANLSLVEKAYDNGTGWYTGGFSVAKAVTRASLAACFFKASAKGVSLRDGSGWYDGGFKQASIPGSKVAAIAWGDVQIRVYFQNGTKVTAVTEWCWSGGWVAGNPALPPA